MVPRPSELPPSASSVGSHRQVDQKGSYPRPRIGCSQEAFRAVLALVINPHPWSLLFFAKKGGTRTTVRVVSTNFWIRSRFSQLRIHAIPMAHSDSLIFNSWKRTPGTFIRAAA